MSTTQDSRDFSVSSSLGPNVLLFESLKGQDRLGCPFEYHVQLLSENNWIDPSSIVGTAMSVTVALADGGQRYFHGIVTEFAQLQADGASRYYHYRAVLRPWLWLLTRSGDCRVYQNQSVIDIVSAVFQELGFTDFQDRTTLTYQPRDYVVQYRESHFNFVSRLLEQEGIYYFFEATDSSHNLVLADSVSCHQSAANYDTIKYFPPGGSARRESEHFDAWHIRHAVQTGKVTLNAFDFENPRGDLLASNSASLSYPSGSMEWYDYPGPYLDASAGENYSRIREESHVAQWEAISGTGDVRGIQAGNLFALENHPSEWANQNYLLVQADYAFANASYGTGGSSESTFRIQTICQPAQVPFRSPLQTPKPVVHGPHTAIVVGQDREEIDTDEYGRIKIQFHWDRLGESNENSSCWVRVAQSLAGNQWGSIFLPRIGQEVMVEFLEGDPDRPLITGRLYNADNMPPYTLPDNKTQSGIKTRSTKSGAADNFNELRFEDLKDSEEIYLHAERNFTRVVENDESVSIGYDKKDPGSQTINIYQDRTTTLEAGNDTLTISAGNRDTTISQGNDTLTISQGNRETTISQGNDTLTISQGNQTITISQGACTIEAGQKIELKVGGSSIKIEPAKITLASPEIAISADGNLKIQGAMSEVSGSATLTLKGGMVQIN